MSIGLGKKPVSMAPPSFGICFSQLSKAALIDALWCASQLGTNESDGEITTQAARNAVIALEQRGDRVPATVRTHAVNRIDSDPEP